MLENLQLGYNSIKSLSGANGTSVLYPLKSLKTLNLTHNELREFSLANLRGLHKVGRLLLSRNHIVRLHSGRPSSEVSIRVRRYVFLPLSFFHMNFIASTCVSLH